MIRDYKASYAPEFLVEVAVHTSDVIAANQGESPERLGELVAMRLAEVYGGCRFTIPVGTRCGSFCFDVSDRDLAIYRQFDGHNRAALAAQYSLTERHLYRIVHRVRAFLRSPKPSPGRIMPPAARPPRTNRTKKSARRAA